MNAKQFRAWVGLAPSLVLSLVLLPTGATAAAAQGGILPWGQSSDQVGWQTFVLVTAPSGIPGSNNVEFETWAADEDIYNTTPPQWPVVGSPKRLHPSVLSASINTGVGALAIVPGTCFTPGDAKAGNFPPAPACMGEEVRRNWASFQYIVGNKLFSKAGLAAAAQSGFVVDLPADSIEVKAEWVTLKDLKAWQNNALTDAQIRQLYHVNSVNEASGPTEYALIAFHFSTKQIKNWVWVDFEHELNPGRCDDTGCHDSFGAKIADVSAKNSRGPNGQDINGNQAYGACAKSDAVEAMMKNAGTGDQWRHYCLKGSQIDFVDAAGKDTVLGNSVIERIAAGVPILKSSCMTCHAFAAFRQDGSANRVPNGPLGPFNPASIAGMTQNDFIWGNATIR